MSVYGDEGVTGTCMAKREGFNAMVEAALAGRIDLILTKSVSRFARNTVDSLTTIRKLKELIAAMAAPLPVAEDNELLKSHPALSGGVANRFFRFFGVPDTGCSVHIGEGPQVFLRFSALKLSLRSVPPYDIVVTEAQLIGGLECSRHADLNALVALGGPFACRKRKLVIVRIINE